MKQRIEKLTFNSTLARFGKGLFETIKIHRGTPLLLQEHLDRLFNSMQELGMEDILFDIIADNGSKLGVREGTSPETNFGYQDFSYQGFKDEIMKACRGRDKEALRISLCDEGYNFSFRKITYDTSDYARGFKVAISPVKRGFSPIYYHKTSNYFENIYSLEKAKEKGYQESLFLTTDGKVLEGALSNVFFISGNELHTPSLEDSLLPGIMRDKLIEAAGDLGIDIFTRRVDFGELGDFDFAFVTNSLVESIKVKEFEESSFGQKRKENKKAQKIYEKINCKVKELIYE